MSKDEFRIDAIVAEAIAASNRDDERAVKLLIKGAATDRRLCEYLLYAGASQALRNYYSGQRQSARSETRGGESRPKVEPAGQGASDYSPEEKDTNQRRREHASEFWSKYTLFGHTRLCDASIRDLRVSAKQHRAQAQGHNRAAVFETRLAEAMQKGDVRSNNVKVPDFFTLKQVIAIFRQSENAEQ